MTTNTTTLVQQLRAALCTAHALLFGSRPHGQADIDMLRAASRQGITAADQWLAKRDQPPQPDWRDWMIGMRVSVDVSTGDADEGHRYFGTITEVMDDPGEKYGVTILVQDAEPNFDPAAPQPLTDDAVGKILLHCHAIPPGVSLVRLNGDPMDFAETMIAFARAIERAHGIGQPANKPGATK